MSRKQRKPVSKSKAQIQDTKPPQASQPAMMNFIRSKLKVLMWVVAGLFVVSLFAGGGYMGRNWFINILPTWLLVAVPGCARSAGIIMRIGNYNVDQEEFLRIKENTVEVTRMRFRENFDTYARNMDFDKETIDSLIKYAVLLQEAEKYGIDISKTELDQGIRNFPYDESSGSVIVPDEAMSRVKLYPFYSMAKLGGSFNQSTFANILANQAKITPTQFESELNNILLIARLKDTLNESVFVTDLEIEQEFKRENEKAKIKFVEFPYKNFNIKVEVGDDELEKYFQENLLKYKVGDKVSIKFIKLDPKDIADRIVISDAEVESYYMARRDQDYSEPEQVNAQHILVKIDASATKADKDRAKAYAQEILSEAQKPNANFPAIAEKFNKPPHEVLHEDLGFFGRGRMVPTFEEAAFSMESGEVKGVVETSFGYHIVKAIERRAARIQPLEIVRDEIIQKLKEEQSEIDVRQKADDIQYTIMSAENLQAAVDANPELNLRVEETGFFAKGEYITNIGSGYTYKDITDAAFNLKVGAFSDLIEVKSYDGKTLGFFIFQLLGQKPGGFPKLDEVYEKVITDLKDERAKKLAMDEAKRIIASHNPESLNNLAGKNGLEVKVSEPFNLSPGGSIRGENVYMNSNTAMIKAFSMNIGEVAGPFEGASGAYIIELVEREKIDESKLKNNPEEIQKLRNQILNLKQRKAFDSWYQDARNRTKIKSFIPELYQET